MCGSIHRLSTSWTFRCPVSSSSAFGSKSRHANSFQRHASNRRGRCHQERCQDGQGCGQGHQGGPEGSRQEIGGAHAIKLPSEVCLVDDVSTGCFTRHSASWSIRALSSFTHFLPYPLYFSSGVIENGGERGMILRVRI